MGDKNYLLIGDGVLKDSGRSLCSGRGGKDDSNVAPFRTIRLTAFTNLSSVMRPMCFLLYLILILNWTKSDHDKKSLHHHTIPSLCGSNGHSNYSYDREKHHTLSLDTKVKHCLWCNQHRAARAVWIQYGPSTPWLESKTGKFARSSRSHAQPFLLSHCCQWRNSGISARPAL